MVREADILTLNFIKNYYGLIKFLLVGNITSNQISHMLLTYKDLVSGVPCINKLIYSYLEYLTTGGG